MKSAYALWERTDLFKQIETVLHRMMQQTKQVYDFQDPLENFFSSEIYRILFLSIALFVVD